LLSNQAPVHPEGGPSGGYGQKVEA